MSLSTAVGKVSESLRELLLGRLQPQVPVTILSPDEDAAEDKRLNLFLYRVAESPHLKNIDFQPKPDDPNTLMAPPLSLTLYYLLTPYMSPDPVTGNADAHGILGEAMRVFHENAVVPEEFLENSLKAVHGQVKITYMPLSLDDMGKIWNAFNNPFRLSVAYEVAILQIDTKTEKAIPKRVETARVLPVESGFRQPRILSISPMKGQTGDTVTVSGSAFTGWNAFVKVGAETVLGPGSPITQDTEFTFQIPTDLLAGMYEVFIDVGNIARERFFFEIT